MPARYLPMIATALIAACVAAPCPSMKAQPTDEEYAVYSALLFDRWAGEGKSAFVIQGETTDASHSRDFDETVEFLKKKLQDSNPPISLESDLVESFRRIHSSSVRLDQKRLGVPNATIVPSAEIDPIFRGTGRPDDSWGAFRNRFGGAWGIIRLSRVGFSGDHNRALLSVSGSCGPLCGSGDFVLLQKRDGEWRVVARVMAWIS